MKFNDKELAELSCGPGTIEGRLHHKKVAGNFTQTGFKEKWFKLKANILFYFHLSEMGQVTDTKPAGAMVIENAIIQYEMLSEAPFSFSITYHDDLEKKHLFSARAEANVNNWVTCLKQCSYEYWRSQLLILQTKITSVTGTDPLLMYPRSEGSRLAPVPRESPRRSPKSHKKSSFCSYLEHEALQTTSRPEDTEAPAKALHSKLPPPTKLPPPPIRPPRRLAPTRPAPDPPATSNLIDL